MMWRAGIWIVAAGIMLLSGPSALAVEVTPLGADGSSWVGMGGSDNQSTEAFRNPHPGWVFVGLVSQPVWERYGLRPSAFAMTGTRPFDPASLPVMPLPKSRTSGRSSAASSPKSPASLGMSAVTPPSTAQAFTPGASASGTRASGTSTPRASETAKAAGTANPYSGAAPATGVAKSAAGTPEIYETGTSTVPASRKAAGDDLYPATGGVTHARAPSSTQTEGALANKPSAEPDRPRVAIVPEYPAPQTPRNSIAPIVLPPNNGRGALTAI